MKYLVIKKVCRPKDEKAKIADMLYKNGKKI